MNKKQRKAYGKIIDAACETEDFEWFRKNYPFEFSSVLVLHMAFHKIRIERVNVTLSKRQDSLEWLRERGLTRFSGHPLPDVLT